MVSEAAASLPSNPTSLLLRARRQQRAASTLESAPFRYVPAACKDETGGGAVCSRYRGDVVRLLPGGGGGGLVSFPHGTDLPARTLRKTPSAFVRVISHQSFPSY